MVEITHREIIGTYERTHRVGVLIESHVYEGKEVWSIYNGSTFHGNAESLEDARNRAQALIDGQKNAHEGGFVIEDYHRSRA